MTITLRELWQRITWYPEKFAYYREDKNEEDTITDRSDMDKFVLVHGDEVVSDFLIDFEPSRVWVSIVKETEE